MPTDARPASFSSIQAQRVPSKPCQDRRIKPPEHGRDGQDKSSEFALQCGQIAGAVAASQLYSAAILPGRKRELRSKIETEKQ